MLNRRELIASTVALSVASRAAASRMAEPVSGARAGTADTTGPTVEAGESPARYFIASRDLPDAHPAACAAAARGETVVWIGSDVTPVYTRLDLELRPAPFAVAGLTSAHHLFVLERLGWDRGLRTVRRSERGPTVNWRLDPGRNVSDPFFGGPKKGSDTFFLGRSR